MSLCIVSNDMHHKENTVRDSKYAMKQRKSQPCWEKTDRQLMFCLEEDHALY